jgi:signal transduction histidine kinase/DNA-binding response OmpR family regulator
MPAPNQHILLVEADPQVSDVIAQQILRPLGYQVDVIESASLVLSEISVKAPNIIITNLHLPGFSGKDLLIALTSQGIDIPVIVISSKGQEGDTLQAFRLGAMNFITSPIREAEVVNVVEDTFTRIQKRNALEVYSQKLDQVNQEIDLRIQDFSEIFSIGKLVPSSTSQLSLYEKIIHAAIQTTRADSSWLLVVDPSSGKYILRACSNKDIHWQSSLHHPYENGLSSLVAASGQAVSIYGEAIKRFNLDPTESILVVPIKHEQDVRGMLAVERKQPQPFTNEQKNLLELIAEYAEILLENFFRFQNLEQQLVRVQQSSIYSTIDSDLKNDLLFQAGMELHDRLTHLIRIVDNLSVAHHRKLTLKQTSPAEAIHTEIEILMDIADSMIGIPQGEKTGKLEKVDLNKLVREVVDRYQTIAQTNHTHIKLDLPLQPLIVTIFTSQIIKVVEGSLSNAIKNSPPKSHITIRVEKKDDDAIMSVKDQGTGIDDTLVEGIFERKTSQYRDEGKQFGGIGISLPMIKEIISAHRGKVWVKSGNGKGFTLFISIPL